MKEARHTKGPWRLSEVDQFGDYTIQPPDDELAIAAVVNGSFRELSRQRWITEANAALIAAAPDMYEALELLLQHEPVREDFQSAPKGDMQFKAAIEDFAKARAALSKARGEHEA